MWWSSPWTPLSLPSNGSLRHTHYTVKSMCCYIWPKQWKSTYVHLAQDNFAVYAPISNLIAVLISPDISLHESYRFYLCGKPPSCSDFGSNVSHVIYPTYGLGHQMVFTTTQLSWPILIGFQFWLLRWIPVNALFTFHIDTLILMWKANVLDQAQWTLDYLLYYPDSYLTYGLVICCVHFACVFSGFSETLKSRISVIQNFWILT